MTGGHGRRGMARGARQAGNRPPSAMAGATAGVTAGPAGCVMKKRPAGGESGGTIGAPYQLTIFPH